MKSEFKLTAGRITGSESNDAAIGLTELDQKILKVESARNEMYARVEALSQKLIELQKMREDALIESLMKEMQ